MQPRTLELVAWLLASCLVLPCGALAEHVDRLFISPELRVRPAPRGHVRNELALSHGLASAHTELTARVGIVLPARDESLAFPFTVGLRTAPFDTRVRPLVGGEVGGYFSAPRGGRRNESPSGAEWTWSMRALAGIHVELARLLALRVYADAQWAQRPRDARLWGHVFSSLGVGCEVLMRLPAPRLRLLEMVVHGKGSPSGW